MVKRQSNILINEKDKLNSSENNKKTKKEIKFRMILRGKKTYKNQTMNEITLLINKKKKRKKLNKTKNEEKTIEKSNKEIKKIIKIDKIHKEESGKKEKQNKENENKENENEIKETIKSYKENSFKNKLKASIQVNNMKILKNIFLNLFLIFLGYKD
jgi:hypothetical protein